MASDNSVWLLYKKDSIQQECGIGVGGRIKSCGMISAIHKRLLVLVYFSSFCSLNGINMVGVQRRF